MSGSFGRWRAPAARAAVAVVLGAGLASALVGVSCGRGAVALPPVRPHGHPAWEGVCVPFPAPVVKPESIDERPTPTAVWVDGHWAWRRRRWVWQPGSWFEPPFHASYSPAESVRLANGALVWFPPHWHEDGQTVPPFDLDGGADAGLPLCPAPTPPPFVPPGSADAAPEDAGNDAASTRGRGETDAQQEEG